MDTWALREKPIMRVRLSPSVVGRQSTVTSPEAASAEAAPPETAASENISVSPKGILCLPSELTETCRAKENPSPGATSQPSARTSARAIDVPSASTSQCAALSSSGKESVLECLSVWMVANIRFPDSKRRLPLNASRGNRLQWKRRFPRALPPFCRAQRQSPRSFPWLSGSWA